MITDIIFFAIDTIVNITNMKSDGQPVNYIDNGLV